MPVRDGIRITTRLTKEEVRQLRIIAIMAGMTLTDLVTKIIRDYLRERTITEEELKEVMEE